jgi:hypothetical protein
MNLGGPLHRESFGDELAECVSPDPFDPEHLHHFGYVAVRLDSADVYTLLEEVGFMFGTGPFLTPTKLEATLLALESIGAITAVRGGTRTTYSLAGSIAIR